MSSVDVLIVLVVFACALGGILAGLVRGLYCLFAFVMSLLFAVIVQNESATAIVDTLAAPHPIARAVALVESLLSSYVVFSLAGRIFLGPVVEFLRTHEEVKWLEHGLGALPSAYQGLMVATAGIAAIVLLPIGSDVRAQIHDSPIGRALVSAALNVQPALDRLVDLSEGDHALFVTRVASDRRQPLAVEAGAAFTASDEAEDALLALVNIERAKMGLGPLDLDPVLVRISREHSGEMLQLRYLGHDSAIAGSLEERLAARDVTYTKAAQSIALSALVTTAFAALIDREADRANIVDRDVTRIGIGVMAAEPYGLLITMVFLAEQRPASIFTHLLDDGSMRHAGPMQDLA